MQMIGSKYLIILWRVDKGQNSWSMSEYVDTRRTFRRVLLSIFVIIPYEPSDLVQQ
jgi:hypothetical protein